MDEKRLQIVLSMGMDKASLEKAIAEFDKIYASIHELEKEYEQGEERYLSYLWPSFRLVQDIDDRRSARYGVYYTQKKPLTKAASDGRK